MAKRGQRLIPEAERKKHQIGVRLTEDELQALEKISKEQGLPIARFVREGVELVIKKYSKH
jgi:predicted DNA binding CopG/RHH family protein